MAEVLRFGNQLYSIFKSLLKLDSLILTIYFSFKIPVRILHEKITCWNFVFAEALEIVVEDPFLYE